MCGIFGVSWSGKAKKYKSPIAPRMLTYMNQERGRDSCGMAYLGQIKDTEDFGWATYKSLGDPHLMLQNNPFDFNPFKSDVVLGHCRSASGGTAQGTLDTVHPFRYGNIILAHNGFISNWRMLLGDTGDAKDGIDIDSKLLAWRVANMPIKDVFKDLIGKIATWWVDVNDPSSIFLYTWKKELAITKSGESPFIFSSDIKHLLALGVPKQQTKEIDQDIGQLMKVDVSSAKVEVIDEFECAPDATVTNARWTEEQRRTYISLPVTHRRGFFRDDDDNDVSSGVINTIAQLKQKWSVAGENQDEKATTCWDVLTSMFDGGHAAQCWKCNTIYVPKEQNGLPDWRCKCGGMATHSNDQEKFVIARWIADQMLIEELDSFITMCCCDKESTLAGHRKCILTNILKTALEAKINTSEAAKAEHEDKLLDELEDNGEIVVAVIKRAAMSERTEQDNPMAEGTP